MAIREGHTLQRHEPQQEEAGGAERTETFCSETPHSLPPKLRSAQTRKSSHGTAVQTTRGERTGGRPTGRRGEAPASGAATLLRNAAELAPPLPHPPGPHALRRLHRARFHVHRSCSRESAALLTRLGLPPAASQPPPPCLDSTVGRERKCGRASGHLRPQQTTQPEEAASAGPALCAASAVCRPRPGRRFLVLVPRGAGRGKRHAQAPPGGREARRGVTSGLPGPTNQERP